MLNTNVHFMEMVLSLANKYGYDQKHAMSVERLAVKLFEELGELHFLGESELNLLRHGALLHDIGIYVAVKKHHKHSAYLVLHDEELNEYPPKEREMLALLVRNHRKGIKLPDSDLSRQEYKVLVKLVAILRIADVLDYYHQSKTIIEAVTIKDSKCFIKVSGISLVEIKKRLVNKSAFFKKAFDLKAVVLSTEDEIVIKSKKTQDYDVNCENKTIEDNFVIVSEDDSVESD